MTTGKEIFEIWAPREAAWSQWASPVAFAYIDCDKLGVRAAPATSTGALNVAVAPGTAYVIDLPGAPAIRLAMRLARVGLRPVPVFNASPAPLTPATNHMITLVDRFQERLEMLFRPRFFRCGYQHERQCGSAKATFQCTANTFCSDRHDRRFDGPPKRTHQVRQGCADGFCGFRW